MRAGMERPEGIERSLALEMMLEDGPSRVGDEGPRKVSVGLTGVEGRSYGRGSELRFAGM
jgi:hypothetical protein